MSIQNVREYLRAFALDGRVMEFDVSSATVELAAVAVGVEPALIAKTISLHADGGCMLLVAAGDARIDNRKFKDTFLMKARMLSHDEALEYTGHAVGGVCPFALPENVKVYLDVSLKRFEYIYPAAGSASSAVKLTPGELFTCSGASGWVDVCSLPQREA